MQSIAKSKPLTLTLSLNLIVILISALNLTLSLNPTLTQSQTKLEKKQKRPFFLSKNHVYKNVEAQIFQKIRTFKTQLEAQMAL